MQRGFLLFVLLVIHTTSTADTSISNVSGCVGGETGHVSRPIALEATANITGDSLSILTDLDYDLGDKIKLSLSGGAEFAAGEHSLESCRGGAGDGYLGCVSKPLSASSSTIEFTLQEPCDRWGFGTDGGPSNLILSGDTIAGRSTTINLPQVPGRDIFMTVEITTSGDVRREISAPVEVFTSTLSPVPAIPGTW